MTAFLHIYFQSRTEVQNWSKSVKICRSYWRKFAVTFFLTTVYIAGRSDGRERGWVNDGCRTRLQDCCCCGLQAFHVDCRSFLLLPPAPPPLAVDIVRTQRDSNLTSVCRACVDNSFVLFLPPLNTQHTIDVRPYSMFILVISRYFRKVSRICKGTLQILPVQDNCCGTSLLVANMHFSFPTKQPANGWNIHFRVALHALNTLALAKH